MASVIIIISQLYSIPAPIIKVFGYFHSSAVTMQSSRKIRAAVVKLYVLKIIPCETSDTSTHLSTPHSYLAYRTPLHKNLSLLFEPGRNYSREIRLVAGTTSDCMGHLR